MTIYDGHVIKLEESHKVFNTGVRGWPSRRVKSMLHAELNLK